MNALPPHSIAALGVTRTFQNIQLYRDLSVLENVMMGYHLRMKSGFLSMLLRTKAAVEEEERLRQEAMDRSRFSVSPSWLRPRRSRSRTGSNAWSRSRGRSRSIRTC